MEYKIEVDETSYDVVVTYKKIKMIYIRVENGKLKVSAPVGTTQDFINKTILKHKNQLLEKMKQRIDYYDYRDDGFVFIFNKAYKIKLMNMKHKKCVIHDDVLYVYHKDVRGTVELYLKDILYKYIDERIRYYLKNDFKLKYPKIEIKKYKSRWGCCYTKENRVSFNLSLVYLDKELVNYVIVHELTHFLVPNHSKDFYYEMSKRLKDYKIRQKRLKEKHT